MDHELVDHAVFLLVAVLSHLLPVYHLVGEVLLYVLYCFWNIKQPDYIGVQGIRQDELGRDNILRPGDYLGGDLIIHDDSILEHDTVAAFGHYHRYDVLIVAYVLLSDIQLRQKLLV